MALAPSQTGTLAQALPAPPPDRFHQVWRRITFLLVMNGFLSLAISGELHPIVIVLFLVAWFAGLFGYQPGWPRWVNRLLVGIVLLPIGLIALQWNFASLLYLLLFLGLYKCLNLREAMDHLHALLMAFFMLLATSIITNSLSYIFFLVLFLLLGTMMLVCFNMAREGERAVQGGGRERPLLIGAGRGAFFLRLVGGCLLISVMVLAFSFALFLLMPRYRRPGEFAGPLARSSPEAERVSGYGDEVNFTVFDRMAMNSTEVLTVEPKWEDDADRPLPSALRLRGTSLEVYDERRWTQPEVRTYQSRRWNTVELPLLTALPGPALIQRIDQNLTLTNRIFGAAQPVHFDIEPLRNLELRVNWSAQAVQATVWRSYGGDPRRLQYTVRSYLNEEALPLFKWLHRREGLPQPGPTNRLPADVPPRDPALVLDAAMRARMTALPETPLTQKLRAIADREASAPDAPGKVLRLYQWLQADFSYDLTPDTPRGMHPIEGFLTRTHKGHCEYFSTALVLLLRAEGVPSRLVTGFYTSEYDPANHRFVVRQSDAHAWAEIWVDGYGWLTLDPTPPDSRGRVTRMAEQPPLMQRLSSALRAGWQRYVLDYSNMQQQQVLMSILTSNKLENIMQRLSRMTGMTLPFNALATDNQVERSEALGKYLRLGFLLIGLLFIYIVYRLIQRQKREVRPTLSSAGYMNLLLARLQALGYPRRPGQTPAELVAEVERQTEGRFELTELLEYYHLRRFGGVAPDLATENRIHEQIRNLR